jgi:hypothetical protein
MKGNEGANIIRTPEDLVKFLNIHSVVWQNRGEGEVITIVLLACNAAIDLGDGHKSLAQMLSESELFENVVIIAADALYWRNSNDHVGVYPVLVDDNGNPILTSNNNTQADKQNPGNWRVFFNGREILQLPGASRPREIPLSLIRLLSRNTVETEN